MRLLTPFDGSPHLTGVVYAAGRFISVDPVIDVTNPLQMNAYAYGYDNPLVNPDPSGLMPCWDVCGHGKSYVDNTAPADTGGDSEPPEVKKAKDEHERVKKQLVTVAKALGKILMDELGITDAVDCFTKGDVGGCVNTAINVVMSLMGGALGKLAARYLFKWKRAVRVAESLWDLGGKLKTLVGDFFKSRNALKKAESAADSLVDKVDDSFTDPGHFRRTANTGEFAELEVPMQKRAVLDAARGAGVDLKGVKVKINRQADLIGKDLFGYTPNGKEITLYPDAFRNMESLVKTLGHERTHVMQYRLYGPAKSTAELNARENAAYEVEGQFWDFYKNAL